MGTILTFASARTKSDAVSNVVYLSTHPRFPVKNQPPPGLMAEVYGQVTIQNAGTLTDANTKLLNDAGKAYWHNLGRLDGQSDVIRVLGDAHKVLLDEAFRARALGQDSVGKQKEEIAKYLLSLVASLPTKLRGQ